jgi:hypothetical protein
MLVTRKEAVVVKRGEITAVELARQANIDPKALRAALRRAGFRWHQHNAPWVAVEDSPEHHDMVRVCNEVASNAHRA